jgi:transposase
MGKRFTTRQYGHLARLIPASRLKSVQKLWSVMGKRKQLASVTEKILPAPAPFHIIRRGWVGPSFLAMLVFEKFGQHQPLNRQAERYTHEGVPLSPSTLADQVRPCCAVLDPIVELVVAYAFAGSRVHGDDTTVLEGS